MPQMTSGPGIEPGPHWWEASSKNCNKNQKQTWSDIVVSVGAVNVTFSLIDNKLISSYSVIVWVRVVPRRTVVGD